MKTLSDAYIQDTLADSELIFARGKQTGENGSYFLSQNDTDKNLFVYEFDGTFGHYTTRIRFTANEIEASCTCPYPGTGCRHVVAAALNARDIILKPRVQKELFPDDTNPYLSEDQIRDQAFKDRQERAESDQFTPIRGDMFTGDHKVISRNKHTYTVCLHDPVAAKGHCSCPDYLTNGLGTCKHILFMAKFLSREPGFKTQTPTEKLPFIDIFWDSAALAPRLYPGRLSQRMSDLAPILEKYFDHSGRFIAQDISLIMGLMLRLHGDRRVQIRESLLKRVDHRLQVLQLKKMAGRPRPKISLARPLYTFQEKGVDFGVMKTGVLIGDEMGLGKTAQAIAMSLIKADTFGFSRILVITLASLKQKWKQEVETVSGEAAWIIQGTASRRRLGYNRRERFKISHYEAVVKDAAAIKEFNPDIIILDEAQRIRNFSNRTAEAVKRLPKKHAIVLTGTPLENKPEDLYSIVQFLDPYKFTPLWKFATDHYLIPKTAKTRVAGYKNLDLLRDRLKDILIRRTWEEVQAQLPEAMINTFYVDLAPEQQQRHNAYARRLGELLDKKILTEMDMGQIRDQVLHMRMVSNSTFLVDRDTQISPKLRELATIIDEVVVQNQRKMVVFSEWTGMTFLIARHLSESGIGFTEVSKKLTTARRRELAHRFSTAPDGHVFLTTDAGSLGLDLSAARCMVNVELPWTPAQADQRRARLVPPPRLKQAPGDLSTCHIINLVGANSVEEKILKGMSQDPDLFTGLFGLNTQEATPSDQVRHEMARRLKTTLGQNFFPKKTGVKSQPEENPHYIFPEGMASQSTDPDSDAISAYFSMADAQKLERVLNSGIDFMTGLMEMATGSRINPIEDKEIMVDPDTGKVSLSFRLPREFSPK